MSHLKKIQNFAIIIVESKFYDVMKFDVGCETTLDESFIPQLP